MSWIGKDLKKWFNTSASSLFIGAMDKGPNRHHDCRRRPTFDIEHGTERKKNVEIIVY